MANVIFDREKSSPYIRRAAQKRIGDETSRLDEAAKQIITITVLLQGIYFVVFFFNNLIRTFPYHDYGLRHIFLILPFAILPFVFWSFSLAIALLFIMMMPGKALKTNLKIKRNLPYSRIKHIFLENLHNRRIFLYISHLSLSIGLFILIIMMIQISTNSSQNHSIESPLELFKGITEANNEASTIEGRQISANVSIPSIIIQRCCLCGNITEACRTNATGFDGVTDRGIWPLSIIAIIIGIIIGAVITTWWATLKRKEINEWWKHPLGLPKDSIKAIITLIFLIAIILHIDQPQTWIMGMFGMIIGFYFSEKDITNKTDYSL